MSQRVNAAMGPSAPTNVLASATSDGKVSVTWTASVPGGLGIKSYAVYRGISVLSLPQIGITTKTSYWDTTVAAGATYYYGVVAADVGGNLSPMSALVQVQVPTAPAAPAGLTATAKSDTRVSLGWSAAVSGGLPVTYYFVFRGTSPAGLAQLATTTSTSYTDQAATPGAQYYYAVEARDSGGDTSPMSATVNLTVPMPPSPPTGLNGSATATTRVALSWSAASGGGLPIAYYQIYRGTSPAALSQVGTTSQLSYTDTTASAGAQYYYGVAAQDSGGDLSPLSPPVGISVPLPPSAPTSVSATPVSATVASISWPPAAGGGLPVSYYQLFRGSSPSSLTQIATLVQTSFRDASLTQGTTYFYAVEAEDSGGDLSPMSSFAPVTTYVLPPAPAGLSVVAASNALPGAAQVTYSASLSWSSPTGGGLPIMAYEVFRGTSPVNLSQIATIVQTSYTDSTISASTVYYYGVTALDTSGDLSPMSAAVPVVTGGGQVPGSFNLLPMTINGFVPGYSTLPGIPSVETSAGLAPSVGYQGGQALNGKVIFDPWQVANGANSWTGGIQNGIPQSVILSYNSANPVGGEAGFANDSNWTYFDLTTLSWYSKGGNQGSNPLPNLPAGFAGGVTAGNMVYPAPIGNLGMGSGGGPYSVFIQYNSLKAIDDPSAYQTFVPPPMGTTMGQTYGWCMAAFDGRFVYYAPNTNTITGGSGNIFRYDTTKPFSNLTTGGVTSAWSNFDMRQGGNNPHGVDPNASGFQSMVYDGYRYIYYIPFTNLVLVRYDTWNGGTGPDPSGFTVTANYTAFNMTLLGTGGYPAITGTGNAANLAGFTGAQIVWDGANQNEYLYFVPWATYPGNAPNPTLESTTARVRVGTMAGTVWSPIDITSTATAPASSTPNWEIYDLSLLAQNPGWPDGWPATQTGSTFSPQTALGGWQQAYTRSSGASGITIPPRVGFVPDVAEFLVEHDVGHHLYDPTGWYLSSLPPTYNVGTMGGGFDASSSTLYPSSPNAQLYSFQLQ